MRKFVDKKVECMLMHAEFYCDKCGKHIEDTVYYDVNLIEPKENYHVVCTVCEIKDYADSSNTSNVKMHYNPINNKTRLELCDACFKEFIDDLTKKLKDEGFTF